MSAGPNYPAQEPGPEIEEPEAEAIDPALEIFPVETPVSTPSPEDLQEETTEELIAEGVYLPLVIMP